VNRAPIPDVEYADTSALDQIPPTELRAQGEALELITDLVASDFFLETIPPASTQWSSTTAFSATTNWSGSRWSSVHRHTALQRPGTRPGASWTSVLRSSSLCDVGMRWGASDFDAGRSNGDLQHFDLLDNGGYATSG
jgi:hypothetical protein